MEPSAMSWISFTDHASDRRGPSLPAYLSRPHKYFGPVFLPGLPTTSPCFPYRAHNGLQAPLLKDDDPPYPRLGNYFPQKPGATSGARCDAECVVVHPAKPSSEKSHPGGLYDAFSRAKSAGRGVYGGPGFAPSALYLQALCIHERVLLRVDNAITADRAVRRIEKLAAATKARRPDLTARFPELVERAKTPLPPELVNSLSKQPYRRGAFLVLFFLDSPRYIHIRRGSYVKQQKIDRNPLLEAPTSIEWGPPPPPPAGTSIGT